MSAASLAGAVAVLAAAVVALLVLRDRKPTTAQLTPAKPTPVKEAATAAATTNQ